MPIYEYACDACGREFELLVRSDTVPQCPGCQSQQLTKQLSVFATANSGDAMAALPEACMPCGTCGNPDGPGACTLQ